MKKRRKERQKEKVSRKRSAVEILSLINLTEYNKSVRPNVEGGPVNVNVSSIKTSRPYNLREAYFELGVYIRQTWKDPRLVHQIEHQGQFVIGGEELLDYIWKPDTVVYNKQTTREVKTDSMLVIVNTNGKVQISNMAP